MSRRDALARILRVLGGSGGDPSPSFLGVADEAPVTDPQTAKQKVARRQGAAYQGAVEAVFAILIGSGIGYWLDGRFDTSPRYLLIGVRLGFAAFVWMSWRLVPRGKSGWWNVNPAGQIFRPTKNGRAIWNGATVISGQSTKLSQKSYCPVKPG